MMDYQRLKRLIGALTAGAALVSLVWIVLGKDVQGMALIGLAGLMTLAGILLLFSPGMEPKSSTPSAANKAAPGKEAEA